VKGPKIRIGKYKKRTGYRRHTGFRAALTQIEIESIGTGKAAGRAAAKAQKETKAEPKAEAPTTEHVKGMPAGYEDMTVSDIKKAAPDWNAPMLAAALEYEQANANRKGAIAAIEAAVAAKEE
jgi:hypothetical protein